MPSYMIEPPDMILVEVLEALPGRPISGERLVQPDGKISLGFYGEVYVAGLTTAEAKEKIVLHLKKYINDEILGLTQIDPQTRAVTERIDPKDTDRVFVQVSAWNSKVYYVQGAVLIPGRLPVTGHETILDAINYAGGLSPRADRDNVILYRMDKDGTLRRLQVNIDQITMGDDPTTNYQLLPGDRLVVHSKPGSDSDGDVDDARPALPAAEPRVRSGDPRGARRPPAARAESPDDRDPFQDVRPRQSPTLRDVEPPAGRGRAEARPGPRCPRAARALNGRDRSNRSGRQSRRRSVHCQAADRSRVAELSAVRLASRQVAVSLELSGECTAMIQLSKTAAAVSLIFCGVLTTFARAQETDEPPPRPRSRPRIERPVPPVPDERAMEPTPPADVVPPVPPSRHPARSGLSEETIRSLKEFPPGHEVEVDEIAPTPEGAVTAPRRRRPHRGRRGPPRRPPRGPHPPGSRNGLSTSSSPPDMLLVEVLEALPGRPISGERLVRPDGRISLGFYGEIPVAGLTIPEIKERVVLRMRRYLNDETLGLVGLDENGEYHAGTPGPTRSSSRTPGRPTASSST